MLCGRHRVSALLLSSFFVVACCCRVSSHLVVACGRPTIDRGALENDVAPRTMPGRKGGRAEGRTYEEKPWCRYVGEKQWYQRTESGKKPKAAGRCDGQGEDGSLTVLSELSGEAVVLNPLNPRIWGHQVLPSPPLALCRGCPPGDAKPVLWVRLRMSPFPGPRAASRETTEPRHQGPSRPLIGKGVAPGQHSDILQVPTRVLHTEQELEGRDGRPQLDDRPASSGRD